MMKALATTLSLMASLAVSAAGAPPLPGVDLPPFGSQYGWGSEAHTLPAIDLMPGAGVRWARSDVIWWELCEQTPGEYVYDGVQHDEVGVWNADLIIQSLVERGIEPIMILSYGSPHYDESRGPSTEAGRAAYGDFAFNTVSHFRDEIDYWEIWNEPNLEQFWHAPPNPVDYTRLARAAAPRIREANPEAVILGGSTSGVDLGFLEACFAEGLLDVIDVLTVHPYRTAMPESADAELRALRDLVDRYAPGGHEIPIWSGEWGYNTAWTEISEGMHPKYLTRQIVNNMANGIAMSVWFSFHPYEGWGLIEAETYEPRPSYGAMRTLSQHLGAPIHVVEDPLGIALDPNPYGARVAVFERESPEHLVAALWLARTASDSFEGEPVTVSLDGRDGVEIRAFDALSGDEIPLEVEERDDRLIIQDLLMMDYPVLLEIQTGPSAEN